MNKGILSGLILVIVIGGAIAGMIVFNSMNPKTSGVINPVITDTPTGNNTNTINNNDIYNHNTLFAFIPFLSYLSQSSITPIPSPTPDPMEHVLSLFDAYVKSLFPQTGVPGAAVVIVQNDKIIYQNCLGVKDLASGSPVDLNTLFQIGSATKSFTAINIAQLVSSGSMSWDDPVIKYFPDKKEFQLYDLNVTNSITIRDCLSHRSGLPIKTEQVNLVFFKSSSSDLLYKLRYVENDTAFRSTYEYNNIIYGLAGSCAERATNTPWNELIKDNLLDPLGMNTATTNFNDFINSPNHAKPYLTLVNGTLQQYLVSPDENAPAGSISCSISEITNWLRFQIADTGIYNGKQIVSKKELDETRSGQIQIDNTSQCGLGWNIDNTSISHAGSTYSSNCEITVYPSKSLGMAILTNEGPYGTAFYSALKFKFNYLLNGDERTLPWLVWKELYEPKNILPEPTPPLTAPQPFSTYIGVYSHEFYGNINITTNNNTLTCYYGNNSQPYDLLHWNGDVFEDTTNELNNHNFCLNFTNINNEKADKLKLSWYGDPKPGEGTFNRINGT